MMHGDTLVNFIWTDSDLKKAHTRATQKQAEMRQCISDSNGSFKSHSQYLIDRSLVFGRRMAGSNCRGLSILFLRCEQTGMDIRQLVTGPTIISSGTYDMWSPDGTKFECSSVLRTIRNLSGEGNMGEDDTTLNALMLTQGISFRHIKTETFGHSLSIQSRLQFALFVSRPTYYYLISIHGHTMACVSRMGRIVFYDPNAGIGVFKNRTNFISFCRTYFGKKSGYGKGSTVVLRARRYRAGW